MRKTNKRKRKRRTSKLSESPTKKQKTVSSLLELCMKGEWNSIIKSAENLIHVWDFEEANDDGNNSLHLCCLNGSLDVLRLLLKLKPFKESPKNKENHIWCLLY